MDVIIIWVLGGLGLADVVVLVILFKRWHRDRIHVRWYWDRHLLQEFLVRQLDRRRREHQERVDHAHSAMLEDEERPEAAEARLQEMLKRGREARRFIRIRPALIRYREIKGAPGHGLTIGLRRGNYQRFMDLYRDKFGVTRGPVRLFGVEPYLRAAAPTHTGGDR